MRINLNTEEENPDENFFDRENLEYRIKMLITKNTQFPTYQKQKIIIFTTYYFNVNFSSSAQVKRALKRMIKILPRDFQ